MNTKNITAEDLKQFYQELKQDALKQIGNLLDDFILLRKTDMFNVKDALGNVARNANTKFHNFVFEQIGNLDVFNEDDQYEETRG